MNCPFSVSLIILVCITASESQVMTSERVHVATNGSVELSCPWPALDNTSWLRLDGESLSQVLSGEDVTLNGSKLAINGFRGSLHAGQYFCVATIDGLTTVSCPATLTHAYIQAGLFTVDPVNTTVAVNSTAVLMCQSPFSEPPADYHWRKNGVEVNATDPRVTVLSTGDLYLSPAQPSDAGEYQCVAQNPVTRARRTSTIASLSVSSALEVHNVTVHVTPLVLSKAVGEAATFVCIASGDSLIMWEKVHSRSFPPTATVLPSGSLVIDPVTSEDGGVYRCIAESRQGAREYADVELEIRGPPVFTHTPPATVTLGETPSLKWEVQDNGFVQILLFRNGHLLDVVSGTGELSHMHSLDTSDEEGGTYLCLALGSYECARNTVIVLNVPTTPETTPTATPSSETTPTATPPSETTPTTNSETAPITTSPVTTDAEQRTTVSSTASTAAPMASVEVFPDAPNLTTSIPVKLVCVVTRHSTAPVLIFWTDPSREMILDSVVTEGSRQSNVSVSVSVPGNYTCSVSEKDELQVTSVNVMPAPLTMSISSDVSTRVGGAVELVCGGEGSGVTLEWWKGSQSLGPGTVTRDQCDHRLISNYNIAPIVESDEGEYICRVSSPYFPGRTLEGTITLNVSGPSVPGIGPPLNVNVEASSQGGVVITWDPPQTTESLTGYKLNWGSTEPISQIALRVTSRQNRRFWVYPPIFAEYGEKVTILVWAYTLYEDGEPVRVTVSPFPEFKGTPTTPVPERNSTGTPTTPVPERNSTGTPTTPVPERSCTVLLTGSHNAILKFGPHTLTSLSHTCTEAQVSQDVDVSMVTDDVLLEGLLPSCTYTFNVMYVDGEQVSCDLITPPNEVDISARVQRYPNGSLSVHWTLPPALRSDNLIEEINWGRGWMDVSPGQHFPLEAGREDFIQLRFRLREWVGVANITIPPVPTTTTSEFDPTELGLLYGVVFGGLLVLIVLVLLVILSLKYVQATRRENDKISDNKEKEREHFRRMSMERVSKNSLKRPAQYVESKDNTSI